MEYTLFKNTIDDMKKLACKTDSTLVGFSGGKDSLVCLDLCLQIFKKVIPFFLYLVPGLDVEERELQKARDRYGVEFLYYPHWVLFRILKYGIYCDNSMASWDIPDLKVNDIHKGIIADTGIPLICWWAKKCDSMWRRRYFSINKFDQVFYPLKDWNKNDAPWQGMSFFYAIGGARCLFFLWGWICRIIKTGKQCRVRILFPRLPGCSNPG